MALIRRAYDAIQKREGAEQSMTRKSLPAGDESRTNPDHAHKGVLKERPRQLLILARTG
jgi:hypothetical protein